MKVLFLCPFYPTKYANWGGVFFRNYARALARRGHEVTVLRVADHNRNEIRERKRWFIRDEENEEGVRTLIFFFPKFPKLDRITEFFRLFFIFRFYSILFRNDRPDIVHAHFAESGIARVASVLARKKGIPFVLTEHSTTFLSAASKNVDWRSISSVCAAADARNAVAAKLKKVMESGTGLRFGLLPNCVDEERVVPPIERTEGGTSLACIGFLVEKKNHAGLLRAFSSFRKEQPDARLTIVGGGPEMDRLQELSKELGIAASVRLTGILSNEDALDVLGSSDYFVLPSFVETFGVVALEALFCGLPVLTTRNGGTESFVEDGIDGYHCSTDPDSIAEGLRRLTARSWDRAAIRTRAVERYSYEAVGKKMEEIYAEAINNHALRARGANAAAAAADEGE